VLGERSLGNREAQPEEAAEVLASRGITEYRPRLMPLRAQPAV